MFGSSNAGPTAAANNGNRASVETFMEPSGEEVNSKQLHKLVWAGLQTSISLIVMLLLLLFAFGESISHFEAPVEIQDNRNFRDLLVRLRESGVSEGDIAIFIDLTRRDEVKGLEGFSTFDAELNDWVENTASGIFGAASYSFDLASTIGYGHFTARTMPGRLLTIFCIIIAFPVAVVAYTRFAELIFSGMANCLLKSNTKYKAVIEKYDTHNDGTLDAQEIHLVFQDLGLEFTAEQTELIVKQYDFDHDHKLNEKEFRKLCLDLNIKLGLLGRQYFQFEFAVLAFIFYTIIFAVISFFALELSFFDSVYFVIITISTVGLGDVVPPQHLRAPFSLLAFVGVGFTAMLFKAVIDKIYERTDLKKRYMKRGLKPVLDRKNSRIKSLELTKDLVPEDRKSEMDESEREPSGAEVTKTPSKSERETSL